MHMGLAKPCVRPLDGFRHRAVVVGNESQDLITQVGKSGDIAPIEQLARPVY
jgi:hypothetical protein